MDHPDGPPRVRTASQQAGDAAESLVAERLLSRGWQVLARNVRVGREELDILAVDPGPPPALVIVEVRWRRTRAFGLPEETFDHRKRRHLWSAAMGLLAAGELPGGAALPRLAIRLDLVAVEPPTERGGQPRIRHHQDAVAG